MGEERVTYNPCQGYGCHEHCILETHSRDGKIVRTQKSRLPGPPPGSQICSKGIMCAKVPYAKDRLLHPLKRVGERGSGEFEEISWDQAFEEIGEKINSITERFGTRSVMVNCFWCGLPGADRAMNHDLANRFVNGFGASRLEHPMVDMGSFLSGNVDFGLMLNNGRNLIRDADNMVLIWGANPIGFTRPGQTSRMLLDAQERGAKLIHISNLFDVTSAKVDEWVHIKSGTDAALALAMAHVLVRENWIDYDFLTDKTTAAYLVREDTGKYVRANEVIEGGASDEYVFVDETDGSLHAVGKVYGKKMLGQIANNANMATEDREAYLELMESSGSYGTCTPELDVQKTVTIDGAEVVAKTAYRMLREHLEEWTPERQEEITGVPAETAERIAREYYEATPACIFMYDGFRYRNATQACRGIYLLTYLTGNFGKKGGSIIVGGDDHHPSSRLDVLPIYFPEKNIYKGDQVEMTKLLESFEDPNYDGQQYKAFINPFANPLLNWSNRKLWKERVLPNLELFVSFEIHMSDTARYADYVLPETTSFERYEILSGPDDCITLCEPAIDPLGETRTCADIWRGIAEQVGVGEQWQRTLKEWCQFKLNFPFSDTSPLVAAATEDEVAAGAPYLPEGTRVGDLVPITWERMEAVKTLHLDISPDVFDNFRTGSFESDSGRIEFYQDVLADVGPMADLQPAMIHDNPLKDKYPLQFYPARHKYFMQSQFTNIPELAAMALSTQSGVALNPVTARERGLVDGDLVDVFNQRGCVRNQILHLREDIAPGIAHMWYSFDERFYPNNDNPQVLEVPENTEETRTEWLTIWAEHLLAKQTASGTPRSGMFVTEPKTGEVFWDANCEVRKAAN